MADNSELPESFNDLTVLSKLNEVDSSPAVVKYLN
jgi:hypothetical protein